MNSEELLKVVARLGKLEKNKIECKNRLQQNRIRKKKDQLRSMKMHGQFGRDTDNNIRKIRKS